MPIKAENLPLHQLNWMGGGGGCGGGGVGRRWRPREVIRREQGLGKGLTGSISYYDLKKKRDGGGHRVFTHKGGWITANDLGP